jgi:glyoxylase-like metal-dependent hydrolase (beta-lactamase superfamily II)
MTPLLQYPNTPIGPKAQSSDMAIHRILDNIFLVDLDLPRPGFHHFISSWVIKGGDRAMVVDPGPSATVAALLNALRQIGIKGVDYVLLTHIHLDHAGGCGDLMKAYPDPIVFCHPQAVSHLSDPERLWQGSVKFLGDLARAYGQPSPVKTELLCSEGDIHWRDYTIQSLQTPGHASHHLCFFSGDMLFAGEVVGVRVPFKNKPYIRPATPPPFRPEIALKSISLVTERSPEVICYGHYGFLKDAVGMLERGQEQIRLWLSLIEERNKKGVSLDEDDILGEILAKDPYVSPFYQLEPDIRERELYFIKNSIRGMVGFVEGQG